MANYRLASARRYARHVASAASPAAPQNQNGWLLFITALSVLVTPIVVAIITSNANQSSTDKDYVNIAVTVLNSKASTPENRKWALAVLNKLSPVPFSAAGNESLESGTELYAGQAFGPNHPLIKKGSEFSDECPEVKINAKKSWGTTEMREYINELSKQYTACSVRHHWGLAMIDILQNTDKTPAALEVKNWRPPQKVYIKP